jgi:hypothetical protein
MPYRLLSKQAWLYGNKVAIAERELLSFCAQHLDGYKCPKWIAIKDDLSRNIHGKIIRPGRGDGRLT